MIKKKIISSEKMKNSGNYINDYAHSFFGKDFQSKPLYSYNIHSDTRDDIDIPILEKNTRGKQRKLIQVD